MTRVIDLYGGPGSGKSTLAADMFAYLKKNMQSVELVREYVKSWAYRGEPIREFDQPYILLNNFVLNPHYTVRLI